MKVTLITLEDLKKLYKMAGAYHTHLLNEDIEEADKHVKLLDKFYNYIKEMEEKDKNILDYLIEHSLNKGDEDDISK